MNLKEHGAHASADWLLYKIRATPGAVALHMEDNADLTTRPARKCKGGDSLIGTYQRPVAYDARVKDLLFVRDEMLAAPGAQLRAVV